MSNRLAAKLLLFASMFLCGSIQAYAVPANYTCTGGHLYLEVQGSDGTWNCWEIAGGCGGEWSVGFDLRSYGNKPADQLATRKTAPDAQTQALTSLKNLKETDLLRFYRTSTAVLAAYRRRANFPRARQTVIIFKEDLAPWLVTLIQRGTLPASASRGICPGDLFPNPKSDGTTGCYPCLGCHPCGDTFCDNKNTVALTNADLSSALAAQRYFVKDGKIHGPLKKAVAGNKGKSKN